MEFHAAISTQRDSSAAVAELAARFAGVDFDLLLVFVSHHHGPSFNQMIDGLRERINARNLIGCTGESIIGPDIEVERAPAIAVWGARMPGVRTLPFYLDEEDLQKLENREDWHERIGVQPGETPGFIVLPEPFSIHADECLRRIDDAFPGAVVVGGMASGASAAGQNRLFINDQVMSQGMVGVSLCGPIHISSVVSQGCRPIGKPFVVTKAQQNIITELGGRPALEVLQEVYQGSAPADRDLIQKGLHLGRVVDERLNSYKPGDFLIRNLMGIVQDNALAINAIIRPGQTVQFHVRDSRTADEEMRTLLTTKVADLGGSPQGGLLFSCNGRGSRLFGSANHDIGVVNRIAEDCQVAGFFAAGEIGPVGRRTFIHGFTSSLILFSQTGA